MKRSQRVAVGLLGANLLVLAGLSQASATSAPQPHAHLAKLDAGLQSLVAAPAGRPADASGVQIGGGERLDAQGRVQVQVLTDGSPDAAAARLRGLGMQVGAIGEQAPERGVTGWLPVGALAAASALDSTKAVLSVVPMTDDVGGTDSGSVLSQGDAAMHGPQARALGATGAGVKIGVISDSINQINGGIADSQASHDLPASVSVLSDDPAGADEGRAMAEIVYDGAPGVTTMAFGSGTANGAQGKANVIDQLVASGAKVIADDIYYLTEPMFQDGVVAQAVDRAKAAGVTYLASAGNRSSQSWEGSYSPMTDPRGVSSSTNDFEPSAATDAVQTLGSFTTPSGRLVLQWAEPWGHATTDFAVDVYIDGVYSSTVNSNNIVTGIPMESVPFSWNGSHTLGIAIRRVSGTGTPKLKYIVSGPTFTIAEHNTASNAINPDAASAAGSLAVAASRWSTPATPEIYSSRGPAITRLFSAAGAPLAVPTTRAKPNLAAADAVDTTVPGFAPFGGTSAATPSAAGIAALIRSANPTLPVDGVAAILTDPAYAIDCTTAAGQPDKDCGSGFIQADRMVTAAKDATPPVVAPSAPAAGPTGWHTGPVAVSWSVSDPNSPIYATSGCAPTTATATTTLTCSASSAGGTGTGTLAVKIDTTAPTGLKAKGLKKKYARGHKPNKKKIKCQASDPESGITSCTIKGIKGSRGKHKVTITATDAAGLVSTVQVKYKIS